MYIYICKWFKLFLSGPWVDGDERRRRRPRRRRREVESNGWSLRIHNLLYLSISIRLTHLELAWFPCVLMCLESIWSWYVPSLWLASPIWEKQHGFGPDDLDFWFHKLLEFSNRVSGGWEGLFQISWWIIIKYHQYSNMTALTLACRVMLFPSGLILHRFLYQFHPIPGLNCSRLWQQTMNVMAPPRMRSGSRRFLAGIWTRQKDRNSYSHSMSQPHSVPKPGHGEMPTLAIACFQQGPKFAGL